MDGGHGGEALGEDAAATVGVGAEEAAHFQEEAHRPIVRGQVSQAAHVAAVRSSGALAAERAGSRRYRARNDERQRNAGTGGSLEAQVLAVERQNRLQRRTLSASRRKPTDFPGRRSGCEKVVRKDLRSS